MDNGARSRRGEAASKQVHSEYEYNRRYAENIMSRSESGQGNRWDEAGSDTEGEGSVTHDLLSEEDWEHSEEDSSHENQLKQGSSHGKRGSGNEPASQSDFGASSQAARAPSTSGTAIQQSALRSSRPSSLIISSSSDGALAGTNQSSRSRVASQASEKTPTARHFKHRSEGHALLPNVAPASESHGEARHTPQSTETMHSPPYASPWDNPSYSQPASPSFSRQDPPHASGSSTTVPHSASAHSHTNGWPGRPRYAGHSSSSSLGGSSTNGHPSAYYHPAQHHVTSAGITKRSSSSSKRNSARLSGSFNKDWQLQSPAAPEASQLEQALNYLASPTTFSKTQDSRRWSSSSGSSSAGIGAKNSRRSSRNLTLSPPSAAYIDMDNTPTPNTLPSIIPPEQPSPATSPENRRSPPSQFARSDPFSLDPLLQALNPASAPILSTSESSSSGSSLGRWSDKHASPAYSPSLARSGSGREQASPVRSPLITKRGSLSRSTGRSRSGSLTQRGAKRRSMAERTSPGPAAGLSQRDKPVGADGKEERIAKGVEPHALLERLQEISKGKARPMLILDVRPLQAFLGDAAGPSARSASRIRGSVNVNFPSLLIKRFRKGSNTASTLESFITTQVGQHNFLTLCPGGDLLGDGSPAELDICVVDQRIAKRDFETVAGAGSVGAVFVSMLERRRKAANDGQAGHKKGEIWYLDGEFSTLLGAADAETAFKGLVAAGPDDNDVVEHTWQTYNAGGEGEEGISLLVPQAGTSSAFSSPASDQRTPTFSSTQAGSPRGADRVSAIPFLTKPTLGAPPLSAGLKAKARALPQLSLSSTSSSLPSLNLSRSYSDTSFADSGGQQSSGISRSASTSFANLQADGAAPLSPLSVSPEGVTGPQQRKQRPAPLKRLDTSERVKQLSSQRQFLSTGSQPAASEEPPKSPTVNGFSGSQRGKGGFSAPAPLNLLGSKRSFQELAMAQSKTPTKANFAAAAGAGPTSRANVAYGADDYANGGMPPPTPAAPGFNSGFSHSRTDSNASTSSNASSIGQYPAMPSFQQQLHIRNGSGEQGGMAPPPALHTPGGTNLGGEGGKDGVVPFNVSVIIPGFLYLGPEPIRVSDVEELESVGIKRILNMAVECDTYDRWHTRFEKIASIPMRDSLAEVNVQERIREACVLLDDADLLGKPTYVHCKAGKSRSVTIVLAYLIHRNHWPLKRAYAHVSERRKGVSPNIGFVAELMRFEEAELGARSQGVLGSGTTPAHETAPSSRNGYFRTHSGRTASVSSQSSGTYAGGEQSGASSPAGSPQTARTSEGSHPLDGRPTIVRHLSLIANTAMNLSADQAGSKGASDAKARARYARLRESLPPGVGFHGTSNMSPAEGRQQGDESHVAGEPQHAASLMPGDDSPQYVTAPPIGRQRSRTGLESAPPMFRTNQNI